MSYQHREGGGYDRRNDNRGPPRGGRNDDRRGGGGNDYGNKRDDRNGGGGYGRNAGGSGRDNGGHGRGGGGYDSNKGGGGYGRGRGGYGGRDGGGGGGGRFGGQRGQSYNDGNSGGGFDSRKRPTNAGYEEHGPPPSKQKKSEKLLPISAEVKAKVNDQVVKLASKEGISAISELYEVTIVGDVESAELTNEVALFLGNVAKFLSGKGATVFSPPGDNLVGGKLTNSISSALFSNCSFLQMTGDHFQLLMSPACERIDELHVELNFSLLDFTSIECKTLTKWLLGKKAKKSSKKLFIRTRTREFITRWIRSLQSDRLDNLYQVRIQCEFGLEPLSMVCGSNGNMTVELRQDGPKEYLLTKFPMNEPKPPNHAFKLNGAAVKVTFVAQQHS